MSATRLLLLGAVRIFQPAHGYLVMRELSSWQADEWASLKPGSIYNGLRTLTKQGMLTEQPGADDGGTKATYRLTVDGEVEFQRLLREAVWKIHPAEPAWLFAGISFWWALPREEVLEALEARRAQLDGRIRETEFAERGFARMEGKPVHVVEFFRLTVAQLRGELDWVAAVAKRVEGGDFMFDGEDPGRFGIPGAFD
jgi:DNA-binding PadR family transcriptional regulator